MNKGTCQAVNLALSAPVLGLPNGSAVKNLPAIQETLVQSLGQEDPLEKEMVNPLQYSCLESLMDGGAWKTLAHEVQRVRHY